MKKRWLARSIAFALSVSMLGQTGATVVYAAPTDTENAREVQEEKERNDLEIASQMLNGWEDVDVEPPLSVREYAGDIPRVIANESKYDPRGAAGIPEVRNQGSLGTCWAHSAQAIVEMNLWRQGKLNNDNMSEFQTVFFMNHDWEDPLGLCTNDNFHRIDSQGSRDPKWYTEGGNTLYTKFMLMDWVGTVSEITYPETKYEVLESQGASASLPDEFAINRDAVHVQDVFVINTEDTDVIKDMVKEHGAVDISYYNDTKTYYNAEYAAYYCDVDEKTSHAVAIVGWDDDFSTGKFNVEHRPTKNGAWLVRNSWGNNWGAGGYFWLSYEDASIAEVAYAVQVVAEGSEDYYDHNYQYDGGVYPYAWSYSNIEEGDGVQIANRFTAQNNETLNAVGVYMSAGDNYEIQIYKNIQDKTKPDSGELVHEQQGNSGELMLEGYHTIKLDEEIELKEGETFSVVVRLTNEIPGSIKFYLDQDLETSSWMSSEVEANSGESFYRVSRKGRETSSSWNDAFYNTYKNGESCPGNVRIKAYTVNAKIVLNEAGISIDTGSTYSLTATIVDNTITDRTVTWSSSNTSVATVSNNGLVTGRAAGTATITAKTSNGKKATCVVKVKDVDATGISLNANGIFIETGTTYSLKATVSPSNTTDKTVTWNSSNEGVATVSNVGFVTGHAAGTATITARTSNGKTAACSVTVFAGAVIDGTQYYATLQEAIDEASEGQEVTLLADVEMEDDDGTIRVDSGKNIILDLNGFNIDNYGIDCYTIAISKDGKLEIKDDSDNPGTITSIGDWDITVSNSGTMIISGGIISGGKVKGTIIDNVIDNRGRLEVKGGEITGIGNWGTVTISGGKVTGTGADFDSSIGNRRSLEVSGGEIKGVIENGGTAIVSGGIVAGITNIGTTTVMGGTVKGDISNSGGAGLTIETGTIEGAISNDAEGTVTISGGTADQGITNSGTTTISGGKIKGTDYAVKNDNGGVLEVSDGEITEEIDNYGTTTVTGGTIKGTNVAIYNDGAELTIEAGTIESGYIGITNEGEGTVAISGGTVTGGIRGIVNFAGTTTVNGGEVTGTDAAIVNDNEGELTLGQNEGGVPNVASPRVVGGQSGIQNSGTFHFYDGRIVSGGEGLNDTDTFWPQIQGNITATPDGYRPMRIQDDGSLTRDGKGNAVVLLPDEADDLPTVTDAPNVTEQPPTVTDTPDEADNSPTVTDTPDEADNSPAVTDAPDVADNPPVVTDAPDEAYNPPAVTDTPDEAYNPPAVTDAPDEADNPPTVTDTPDVTGNPATATQNPPSATENPLAETKNPSTATNKPPVVKISTEQLEKNNHSINAKLKVDQKGNKISVSWGKVKGADGYMVYVQYCDKKFSSKPTKTVKSANATKITLKKINGKKLKLKKNYKVYVVAYQLANGKKAVLGKTIMAHIVGKKNKTYTNVKQIKVSKSKYTLKTGKTAKIKAKTVLVNKKKKQLSNIHAKEFRYRSTDTRVATVSKKGKITAVGEGICIIYVYARNGYAKKIEVIVK